jgi:hypothetical protein
MSHKLNPGDQVRLAPRCHLRGYPRRARGVIVCELAPGALAPGALAPRNYRVTMDRDRPTNKTIILTEDEIEPDA